jgi:protoheme IX farnesyltransferase
VGVESVRAARRLFGFSIFYLFVLFATLLVEAMAAQVIRLVS